MDAIGEALEKGKPAPIPYRLEDMSEDAVGLLEALNVQKAHVVGVSMGGGIAQLVAINHPERILSLTSIMADSGNPALPLVARPEAFAAVSMLLYFLVMFLGGAYLPRIFLPDILVKIGEYAPPDVQALLDTWMGAAPDPAQLAVLMLISIAAGAGAATAFRWE